MATDIDLRQMLGQAVRSAVNLRIVTSVGMLTTGGEIEALKVGIGKDSLSDIAITNINLVQGDIFNCLSPAVAKGELPQLTALHDAMVAKGEGIVDRNVKLLKELIQAGLDRFENVPDTGKETTIG